MSDEQLTSRLRAAYSTIFERSLAREAADEIDRLKAELAAVTAERDALKADAEMMWAGWDNDAPHKEGK